MSNQQEFAVSMSPLKTMEQALLKVAQSSESQRDADFVEAYPLIEQHLAGKVTQKVLLEKFNEAYGHRLYPPGFRKLLEAERKRRSEADEVVACKTCGRPLHVTADAAADSCSEV